MCNECINTGHSDKTYPLPDLPLAKKYYRNRCGVYCIFNRISGKYYVGSSIDIGTRVSEHKTDLRKNRHHNSHLQAAWNKYGEENFSFHILELTNQNLVRAAEAQYIMGFESHEREFGYNFSTETSRKPIQTEWTDDRRKKQSEQSKITHPPIDFTGKTIGIYTVIRRVENNEIGPQWLCSCGLCGKECKIASNTLRKGRSTVCICDRPETMEIYAGQQIGYWFVIKRLENNSRGEAEWLCRCVCGYERAVQSQVLRSKTSNPKHCGCKSIDDLTGLRFGRLSVICLSFYDNIQGKPFLVWECLCDCGKTVYVRANSLRHNKTKSCGCYGLEQRVKKVKEMWADPIRRPEILRKTRRKPRKL